MFQHASGDEDEELPAEQGSSQERGSSGDAWRLLMAFEKLQLPDQTEMPPVEPLFHLLLMLSKKASSSR